jgi:hypothetical protein
MMTRGTQPRPARWRSVAVITLGLMVGSVGTGVGIAALKGVTKKKGDRKFLQNTVIVQQTFTVGGGQVSPLSVPCPPGFQAVGGGVDSPALYNPGGGSSDVLIATEQRPILSGTRSVGWYVEAAGSGTATTPTVYAVCSK